MSSDLRDLITKIRGGLNRGVYTNETSVREAIVLPVLRHINWDDLDPRAVRREFSIRERRVDYGLFTLHSSPDVLIEVKGVGMITGGDKQLFEYAFHDGVPMAVLTTGQEWSFYLPAGQGTYNERRVFKLDLLEHDEDFCAEKLTRYLEYKRVRDKLAIEDARKDYEVATKTRKASQTLAAAWKELIDEPDNLLVDLLVEKTQTLCGYAPTKEDAESFLKNSVLSSPTLSSFRAADLTLRTSSVSDAKTLGSNKVADAPGLAIVIGGARIVPRDAISGLRDILVYLSDKDKTFLDRLAARARGRSRNYLAQSRQAIHPGRPELASYTLELVEGWFLDSNISNRTKSQIVTWACEVAGLKRGGEIEFFAPNIG